MWSAAAFFTPRALLTPQAPHRQACVEAGELSRRLARRLARTMASYTSRALQGHLVSVLALWLAALNATAQELPDPLAAGWQGQDVCELLEQTEELRVLRCTFPPGIGHERHFHAPHYGYALSGGTMELTDERGTRVATLKTGSDFSSSGTPWHTVLNIGDTTVQYLIIEPM
jgi:quercetin dioxygenase-like cupin family protein